MTAASGSAASSRRYAPGRRTGSSAEATREIVAIGGRTCILIVTTFEAGKAVALGEAPLSPRA
jgi:hypothetical protein